MKKTLFFVLVLISTFTCQVYSQTNTPYQLKLMQLKKLDQMHRTNGHMGDKQLAIDLSNQSALDSLYDLYGFPTESSVGAEAQHAMWILIQHSRTDCEFTKKWYYRLVDQFEKGHISPKLTDLLNGTFHRFFVDDPTRSRSGRIGHCYELDQEAIKSFVSKLKQDFTPQTLQTLGIE